MCVGFPPTPLSSLGTCIYRSDSKLNGRNELVIAPSCVHYTSVSMSE